MYKRQNFAKNKTKTRLSEIKEREINKTVQTQIYNNQKNIFF